MENLIKEYESYARGLARQITAYSAVGAVDDDDLVGEALYGLCVAASRYDQDSKVPFTSYSYFRIRGAVMDMVRKQHRCISLDENGFNNPNFNEALGIEFASSEDGDISCYCYVETPENISAKESSKELVADFLDQLCTEEKLVIELIYFEGLSLAQCVEHFNGRSRSYICRVHKKAIDSLRTLITTGGEKGVALIEIFVSQEDVA